MRLLPTLAVAGCLLALVTPALGAPPPSSLRWSTVVNTQVPAPNSTSGRNFNSFNQPSVNASGLVVFRGRTRGGPPEGEPSRGIYVRDMSARNGSVRTVAGGGSPVPYPNNITESPEGQPVGFIEFPSIPRIAQKSNAIATRGNHRPVWEHSLPDGSETRAGTTGIYVSLNAGNGGQPLFTAESKLGGVDTFPFYAVPGVAPATAFDVFPGAPAITDNGVIVFKGNFTDQVAKTGVFYRRLANMEMGGDANYAEMIASSGTPIPNPGSCSPGTTFGSTAPPSAAVSRRHATAVFVGLDDEWDPQCGGIYMAPLEPSPTLTTLVGIESNVPDEVVGTQFSRLGEGLSYDGRFVAFWGAWGSETRTLRLYCPEEGNQDRRDFCNHSGEFAGAGDPASICDDPAGPCYQEVQIPVHQGIFVHDSFTGRTERIGATGEGFDDFLYWVYSGHVPGSEEGGDDDAEPPRWRSSAFTAVSGQGANFRTVFKARSGEISPADNTYQSPVDGLYLARNPGMVGLETLVDTTTGAQTLDPEASPDSLVTAVGIERDGFRGKWLVVNASMAVPDGEEDSGIAGIYITRIP